MNYWLQITAGRGPAECCWVVWQLTHYLINLGNGKGLEISLLAEVEGVQPHTSKSVLLSVSGSEEQLAFLRQWHGSVQWIGKSPFRSGHKRKNWFVAVELLTPYSQEQWDLREIRVDRMRASGPGGQHVNKTQSAVRLTHLGTGLVAVAQEERSQSLNMKLALARLQAMLRDRQHQEKGRFEQNLWENHNQLERGNPVSVFVGEEFRPKS